eukprot:scaffold8510_cov239-Pinguiococcus_pyrenoidosus.AAC.1
MEEMSRRSRAPADDDEFDDDTAAGRKALEAAYKQREAEQMLERAQGWAKDALVAVQHARQASLALTEQTLPVKKEEQRDDHDVGSGDEDEGKGETFALALSHFSQEDARAEAIRRWGHHVPGNRSDLCWKSYLASRLPTPPEPSPLALLQERFAHDGYKLLCCCILMSRVSSLPVKMRCINEFFSKWPTPSAFLDADAADVQPALHSLGLFPERYKGLCDVAAKWLTLPVFDVDLKEHKLCQVGPFGVDSYNLFVRGRVMPKEPADKCLSAFWRWRRQNDSCKPEAD